MNKRAGLIHIIPKSITRNYCNGISNGKTVDCHVSGGTLDNLHVFPSCNSEIHVHVDCEQHRLHDLH